jgi:hypothetical protein
MHIPSPGLRLHLREHQARRHWGPFQAQMSAALQRELRPEQVLSLAETDQLRTSFGEAALSRIDALRMKWPVSDEAATWAMLDQIASCVDDREVYLLHSMNYFIGAIAVSARFALLHARDLSEATKEDLALVSRDVHHGLSMGLNHYYQRDEYELISWGTFSCWRHGMTNSQQH